MSCSHVAIAAILRQYTDENPDLFLWRHRGTLVDRGISTRTDIDGDALGWIGLLRNWALDGRILSILVDGVAADFNKSIAVQVRAQQDGRLMYGAGDEATADTMHVIGHSGHQTGDDETQAGHFEYLGTAIKK
jgi:hypothetical protein